MGTAKAAGNPSIQGMIRKINGNPPDGLPARMACGAPLRHRRLGARIQQSAQAFSEDASAEGRIPCMTSEWVSVSGILRKGYGVASGPSDDYPYGALERQIPIFQARGLNLTTFFCGTLNIDIRPFIFDIINSEFTFRDVRWTDLHPPEHFSFSQCNILFRGALHAGWTYYPHPETKRRNFQEPSLLEVIAPWILGIKHGDELQILVKRERISFRRPSHAE
jgi:hypothetical protein